MPALKPTLRHSPSVSLRKYNFSQINNSPDIKQNPATICDLVECAKTLGILLQTVISNITGESASIARRPQATADSERAVSTEHRFRSAENRMCPPL